jgi:hypothetical protein
VVSVGVAAMDAANATMSLLADLFRPRAQTASGSAGALACRRKFLRFFPRGFQDPKYLDWERNYKWAAHLQWERDLNLAEHWALLRKKDYAEVAARAVRIESRTNLLFSFEKMALRDAVKSPAGARLFAEGLYAFLHEKQPAAMTRFQQWCETVGALPRKQTRVLTWPVVTVFGFLAQPKQHIFLKPMVTRRAAEAYGYAFNYASRPSAETYTEILTFSAAVRADLQDLHPRDLIDIQSFLWVQGSDEY